MDSLCPVKWFGGKNVIPKYLAGSSHFNCFLSFNAAARQTNKIWRPHQSSDDIELVK